MIRVGVVGLGFMGNMHSKCYKAMKGVKLAAICDTDKKKLAGGGKAVGNIAGADALDLTGIELYSSFDKMLKEAKLDAVSITLPTYMHKTYTLKALKAGVNVLCEKPMAMNEAECKQMMDAAKKAKKILQIGHCIRFWPEYVKAKEIIDSGKYGKVKAATFQRLSLTPTWSWSNWLMDCKKSGGALLDLHIHDADYVQYVFGMPKAVYSKASTMVSKGPDHVVTNYVYKDDKVITAEGGWIMSPTFGFEMSFNIILEKAVIFYDCTRSPAFKICPTKGKVQTPKVLAGDGYSRELEHFIKAVSGKKVPTITTPKQSCDSVKLIVAENKSIKTGKKVEIK